MSDGSNRRPERVSKSWPGWQDKSSCKPERTGGLISLYIAIVAAVAVYYMFS